MSSAATVTLADIGVDGRDSLSNPLSKVFGEDGFNIDIKLRPDELTELRELSTRSWLDVLAKVAPDKIGEFEEAGIEQYHRLSHLIDHGRIWTTHTRTFSAEAVDKIRSFNLFGQFDHEYPGYRIISEMPPYGDLGRPRVNWRLVRPGNGKDLGPIHADYWFDAVLEGWSPRLRETVWLKIWIPIYLEQGLTGFAYVPGSHKQKLAFKRMRQPDSTYKPHFDETDLPVPLKTIDTPCGTALLFNYNLVHRGANSDEARCTRVSMEMTLELPRRCLEERYGDLSAFY